MFPNQQVRTFSPRIFLILTEEKILILSEARRIVLQKEIKIVLLPTDRQIQEYKNKWKKNHSLNKGCHYTGC